MELANQGEYPHSSRTYAVLCGFVPEKSSEWQVYRATGRNRPFSRVFVGAEAACRQYLHHDDENDFHKDQALIDPDNMIRAIRLYR
jgi:hypothetical protein